MSQTLENEKIINQALIQAYFDGYYKYPFNPQDQNARLLLQLTDASHKRIDQLEHRNQKYYNLLTRILAYFEIAKGENPKLSEFENEILKHLDCKAENLLKEEPFCYFLDENFTVAFSSDSERELNQLSVNDWVDFIKALPPQASDRLWRASNMIDQEEELVWYIQNPIKDQLPNIEPSAETINRLYECYYQTWESYLSNDEIWDKTVAQFIELYGKNGQYQPADNPDLYLE